MWQCGNVAMLVHQYGTELPVWQIVQDIKTAEFIFVRYAVVEQSVFRLSNLQGYVRTEYLVEEQQA